MTDFFPVLLFILLAAVIAVIIRRNPDTRSVYDERQLLARGNAYKWGFFSAIAMNAVFMIAAASNPGLAPYAVSFLSISIFAGILAFAVYSILKDAFYSLTQKRGNYMILLGICVISQFIAFFSEPDWMNPALILGSIRMTNLCCGITFFIILLLLLWKKFTENNEE